MTIYRLDGATSDQRLQSVIAGRESYAAKTGKPCIVVVSREALHTTGAWLSREKVNWLALGVGGPLAGEVWLANPEEVGA